MNILFVCTANKFRSPTAEHFFRAHSPHHNYKSCGINKYLCQRSGGTYITRELMSWADKIICMEKCHKQYIEQGMGNRYDSKITVLQLQDVYGYNDDELIKKLKQKVDFI